MKEIHDKGFNMTERPMTEYRNVEGLDFSKIKVGVKSLQDAILDLGSLKKTVDNRIPSKSEVLQALASRDLAKIREISNIFYSISGIYQSACDHMAFLYRYDWFVVPEIFEDNPKEEKILKEFSRLLNYLDNTHIKKTCGDIALEVVKNGAYYGYVVKTPKGITLQQLPIKYCRSRYSINGLPAIEFNMRFFDDNFRDPGYRMRVIKLFPPEFAKGYMLFKQGKLGPDYSGDTPGSWYLLDPAATVKFKVNNSDIPMFINAIPALIDLDAAQDLDRRKQMQKLLKILVQQLPLDKNGDLIFDVDEAKDIQNNAVQMLRRAVGVDVITTFADVKAIDTSDKNSSTTVDDLEKVERTVYNALGISKNLFNTDGNLSLEKSILDDESSIRNLLLQFQIFFDRILEQENKNKKKYNFKLYFLETTQYNYKDLSKMYKEQTQLGFSKMLPQIALGHSQSSILNTAYFENEILHLSEIMIPPLMSSTLNGQDILGKKEQTAPGNSQNKTATAGTKVSAETKQTGRPQKADDQKSEKTIQNKESMS